MTNFYRLTVRCRPERSQGRFETVTFECHFVRRPDADDVIRRVRELGFETEAVLNIGDPT